jgi:hypothetical protein
LAFNFAEKIQENKPFTSLKMDDVEKIELLAQPPNTLVEITDRKHLQELIDILHEVVIYKKDNSWNDYAGQFVQYKITNNNGDIITIGAFNPFLIIDGVGYKTKYQPCEDLNKLAYKVIDRY